MSYDPLEIYHKLTRYCAYTERCTADVREKMKKLEVSPDEAEQFLEQLKAENYLNDARYIKSYVRGHLQIKKWGKTKVRMSLIRKGLDKANVDEELASHGEEDYLSNLKVVAERKLKSLRGKPVQEQKQKLFRFLFSRGYQTRDIQLVMKEIGY